MAMKEYSTFPKASGVEPHHQVQFSVICKTLIDGGVLPLCKDAVGGFAVPPDRTNSYKWGL